MCFALLTHNEVQRWLEALLESGKIVLGGRCHSGGRVIVEGGSEEQ